MRLHCCQQKINATPWHVGSACAAVVVEHPRVLLLVDITIFASTACTMCCCLVCRSPGVRKNWRAAFVFDEDESGGTADGVPPPLTGFDSWPMGLLRGGAAATGGTVSNTADGTVGGTVSALLPGLEGSRVLVNTIGQGATANSEPTWESEYGLYAQLLAPGTKGTTAGTAGSTAMSAVLQPSAAAGGGSSSGVGIGGGVRVSLGPVGGSSGKQSTYSVGSMRECSLVALGAGGVTVQRLEAYEMASMWDPEDGL